MEVQEILENYNIYKAKISIIESQNQELKSAMYDLKSSKLDGMPKPQGYTTSNLEEKIVGTQEKIDENQRYIDSLSLKLKIVENLVKTLKKYNQNIIEARFYDMQSIEQIAVNMNKTYGAITKAIKNSISKMQREYNKNKKV